MVRVEMLTVGRELLIGRTVNTNAHWAGGRLARMGTMLKEVTTVDDELPEIAAALKSVVARAPDFLVVVGGLGPTPDDMTLKGLALGMGVEVEVNDLALALMREHYKARGMGSVEMTPSRLKMATLPIGAEPVVNRKGTAPGVRFVVDGTVVFALPGVPSEMRDIFRRTVEPEVRAKLGVLHRYYTTLKLEGVFESVLAPVISSTLARHSGAYVKSHPKGTKEGVSRMELDVAVVGEDAERTDSEGAAIISELTEAVKRAGGAVVPRGEKSNRRSVKRRT